MTEERIFNAGWRLAAEWANREDLIADLDSPRFLKERCEALVQEYAKQALDAGPRTQVPDIDSPHYKVGHLAVRAKVKPSVNAVNEMLMGPVFSIYPVEHLMEERGIGLAVMKPCQNMKTPLGSLREYHGVEFSRMSKTDVQWVYSLLRDALQPHKHGEIVLYQHPKLAQKPKPWYIRWLYPN